MFERIFWLVVAVAMLVIAILQNLQQRKTERLLEKIERGSQEIDK